MNRTKRILIDGEASFILSGFGNYSKELLSRLVSSGKYEVAELASYGKVNDIRDSQVTWRYYANEVGQNDPRHAYYRSKESHQFNEWRLERALLDFKPDIVIGYRDPWMMKHLFLCPLRPFYHLAISPTVDSAPQTLEWINDFQHADGVLTYSDWGFKVLQKEGGGLIPLFKPAHPGVDLDIFKPTKNKSQHKNNIGMEKDIFLIGTVMRNQKRKLFPDLFEAFSIFLDICRKNGRDDIANKTYLYIHTSYPDAAGWDLPYLMNKYGISHKVLYSYICSECSRPFCSFFQDARTFCPNCHKPTAMPPNVNVGYNRLDMAKFIKAFDIYVQYATCEGSGFGQLEAMGCGVPVVSTNYSAMEDIVQDTGGFPVDVQKFFTELESGAIRAYPSNQHCAEIFYKILTMPQPMRQSLGQKARKVAEQKYNWDANAKVWMEYIDSVELSGLQGQWNAPQRTKNPPPPFTEYEDKQIDNIAFSDWIIDKVLQEPDRHTHYFASEMLCILNYGGRIQNRKVINLNRQWWYNLAINHLENFQLCERCRCNPDILTPEDYIDYANLKDSLRK